MARFDTVIKNGTIIDGTRVPRLLGDLAIKDGKVAAVGRIAAEDGDKVIDASDCIVAPGFVDLHTHYDAQIFWDPYCTISGWHGVTSVVIGNCGFGFAPVRPEMRERMMLSMTRVEAIPLASMQAGLPWDWETYPEFLQSLDRTPKGVNVLPFVALGPLLVWVLGLEAAKSGRQATEAELAELKRLLREAMDAGGCGWSAQRLPPYGGMANQRDYDGSPMPTDCLPDETALALASVLGERNEGCIQMTYVSGDVKHDTRHFEELAEVSGRPVLYNAVQPNDAFPDRHRNTMKWINKCREEKGLPVYAQANLTVAGFTVTFEDWNLFDESDAWMEATTGSLEEKLHKLADPDRREGLRMESKVVERGGITSSFDTIVVLKVNKPELKKYENLHVGEIGADEGKHAVDAMLDIAVADNLETVFYVQGISGSVDLLKELVSDPYAVFGASDGGAHTKFFTGGRYTTESLIMFVRDDGFLSLEEAHWRLSALPAYCAGFQDRGTLRLGAPADVVIYNLEELDMGEVEVAHDFPGNEWRRIQKPKGYRAILVNGVQTFDNGKETGEHPGILLRHGRRG